MNILNKSEVCLTDGNANRYIKPIQPPPLALHNSKNTQLWLKHDLV